MYNSIQDSHILAQVYIKCKFKTGNEPAKWSTSTYKEEYKYGNQKFHWEALVNLWPVEYCTIAIKQS